MSDTVLRLGFAMGGGVSLGTFSGSALTETIKWALCEARDKNGDPYKDVVIDVFSGASAGAISLGIMLRSLCERNPKDAKAAKAKLRADVEGFDTLSKQKQRQLIAAQVAQDVQEAVWMKDVRMHRLLGLDSKYMDTGVRLKNEPGLLRRDVLFDVARKYISRADETKKYSGREILGDRVLFCCSLASLIPWVLDTDLSKSMTPEEFEGAVDTFRTRTHQDARIFDMIFDQDSDSALDAAVSAEQGDEDRNYPQRWFRLSEKKQIAGVCADLKANDSWEEIVATAIACGSFPLAFEPMNLRRRHWEYEPEVWKQTFDLSKTDKPESLPEQVIPYVDGGTFNNQPLREAFRLANFLDNLPSTDENFERMIVFIDPFVSEAKQSLAVPHLKTHFIERFKNLTITQHVKERASLDRMVPMLGSIFGAIRNASQVDERARANTVLKKFELRQTSRAMLMKGLSAEVEPKEVVALAEACSKQLELVLVTMLIPSSTVKLASEIRRIIRSVIAEGEASELKNWVAGLDLKKVKQFASDPKAYCAASAHAGELVFWRDLLSMVWVDLAMDLGGKSENRLCVITPRTLEAGNVQDVPFLGAYFAAFAGFISTAAAQHDFEVGRFRAQKVLRAEFNKTGDPILKKVEDPSDKIESTLKKVKPELRQGQGALASRIKHVAQEAEMTSSGMEFAQLFVGGMLSKAVRGINAYETERTFEFRIQVTKDSKARIDSGIKERELRPVKMGKKYYLFTLLTEVQNKSLGERKWKGPGHKSGNLVTERLANKKVVRLKLPSLTQCNSLLTNVDPVFVMTEEEILAGDTRWKTLENHVPDNAQGLFDVNL